MCTSVDTRVVYKMTLQLKLKGQIKYNKLKNFFQIFVIIFSRRISDTFVCMYVYILHCCMLSPSWSRMPSLTCEISEENGILWDWSSIQWFAVCLVNLNIKFILIYRFLIKKRSIWVNNIIRFCLCFYVSDMTLV